MSNLRHEILDQSRPIKLEIDETDIVGLHRINLAPQRDERGYFTEAFHLEKFRELGLPLEFQPVQLNFSENIQKGVTRGIHAEPWNKFVAPAVGNFYVAYVDLREGLDFGTVVQFWLRPGQAVFVPAGCGNSFQLQSEYGHYVYLTDQHWRPGITYPAVDPYDPDLAIAWPIAKDEALLSEKDASELPLLTEVTPMPFPDRIT